MKTKMTKWGIGPKFTLLSILYGAVILVLHYLCFPVFTFTIISRWVNSILGITLILGGISVFIISAIIVHRYFNEDKLCTTGVYAFSRHPLYASWIVFIIPGLIIVTGSILGISIPIFMYIVFKIFIVEEDEYLKEKFGNKYSTYKKEVNAVFPKNINFWKGN